MRVSAKLIGFVALCACGISPGLAQGPRSEGLPSRGSASPIATPHDFTVLSYNVEGLPWPLTHGRIEAAGQIADRLLALRAQGKAPDVVMVQEAFGTTQRRIGALAGYPYSAYGPDRDFAGQPAQTVAERAFEQDGQFWHGEGLGPVENSGLAVFSNYPIEWTRKIAYGPAGCAGWDCLANKGALAVALDVPGQTRPVVVVDTHLNAAGAADVPAARTLAAFNVQVRVLSHFLQGLEPDASAVVLGGDFNIGPNPPRSLVLGDHLLDQDGLTLAAEERVCGPGCRTPADPRTGNIGLMETKSLLAFRGMRAHALTPVGHVIGFGKNQDGTMLSDHVGIAMHFALPDAQSGWHVAERRRSRLDHAKIISRA